MLFTIISKEISMGASFKPWYNFFDISMNLMDKFAQAAKFSCYVV